MAIPTWTGRRFLRIAGSRGARAVRTNPGIATGAKVYTPGVSSLGPSG